MSREGGKVYHVKNILVRADLEKVHVVLVPLEVTRDKNLEQAEEEMMVEVGEVEISTEGSINVSLARDSMQTVAQTAAITPRHVQVRLQWDEFYSKEVSFRNSCGSTSSPSR